MTKQLTAHAKAATMIRTGLKSAGLRVSVRSESFAGGNAVRVTVFDAPTAAVELATLYAKKFQYGEFDGTDDSYRCTNLDDALPQVMFVTVRSETRSA
jgi:hypothetical protein